MDCDEFVSRRELEALLDPLIKGQDRIEKKVDSLIDHKDLTSERLTKLEVRVALIWAVIALSGTSIVAWAMSHMNWRQ